MDNIIMTEILKDNSIHFKHQRYDHKIEIFKIRNSTNLVLYTNDKNKFPIDTDLFYYLDNQSLPYAFLLTNITTGRMFFLNFSSKSNWLSKSFERSNKELIYFGKIILQNEITLNDLIPKLKNLHD